MAKTIKKEPLDKKTILKLRETIGKQHKIALGVLFSVALLVAFISFPSRTRRSVPFLS
jgi:hypothetical protein